MPPAVHGFGTVIQRQNRFLLYYRLGVICMGFNGSRGVYDFSDSEVFFLVSWAQIIFSKLHFRT